MGYRCLKYRYFLFWQQYIEDCHHKKEVQKYEEELKRKVRGWLDPL